MTLRKIAHMNETDHLLVSQSVSAAEHTTDGEIVTIVTNLSDSYHDIALLWASGAAFLALAFLAMMPDYYLGWLDWAIGGWGHEYTAGEYIVLIFIFMALKWLGVWLLMLWSPLRLFFVPKAIKAKRVQRRAIELFKVGAESRTKGRTAILIFLSMKEHRAEIIADEAIAAKVDPEIWGDAMLELIKNTRAGQPGQGMAAAVRQVGIVLTEHFPKGDSNPNELPDRLIEI
jgi:putative membrane protein